MPAPKKPAPRNRRVDVVVKVDLKYPDRDAFVEGFSQNLSRTGLFVRASEPAPVGSRVRFEYRLADGSRVLRGVGLVRWVHDIKAHGQAAHGMGIEFVDLDAASEQLVERIIARHGEGKRAPKRQEAPREHTEPRDTTRATTARAPSAFDEHEQRQIEDLLSVLAGEEPPPEEDPELDEPPPASSWNETTDEAITVADPEPPPEDPDPWPVLLDEHDDPVTIPQDGIMPTSAAEQEPPPTSELMLDLAGTMWRGGIVPRGGAFDDIGDAVWVKAGEGDGAELLPAPFDWLIDPWPAPRAHAVARRLGLSVIDDGSGFPGVVWQQFTLPSSAIVHNGLEKLLGACAANARPTQTRAVLPTGMSSAVKRMVLRSLTSFCLGRCVAVEATTAALGRVASLPPEVPRLLVEVMSIANRLTLFNADGSFVASATTLDGSFTKIDAIVARTMAATLTVPARIDAKTWAELLMGIATKTRYLPHDAPWRVRARGTTLALDKDAAHEVLDEASESLAFTCDLLTRTHGVDNTTVCVVVIPEEPLWPELVTSLTAVFGKPPLVLPPDPWVRLRGLAPLSVH